MGCFGAAAAHSHTRTTKPAFPAISLLLLTRLESTGKSSLLNALCGEERVIVCDLSGTTRDAVDTEVVLPDGTKLTLIDTAGIRKRTKVGIGCACVWGGQVMHMLDAAGYLSCMLGVQCSTMHK